MRGPKNNKIGLLAAEMIVFAARLGRHWIIRLLAGQAKKGGLF
jgi:hypothetical protein